MGVTGWNSELTEFFILELENYSLVSAAERSGDKIPIPIVGYAIDN